MTTSDEVDASLTTIFDGGLSIVEETASDDARGAIEAADNVEEGVRYFFSSKELSDAFSQPALRKQVSDGYRAKLNDPDYLAAMAIGFNNSQATAIRGQVAQEKIQRETRDDPFYQSLQLAENEVARLELQARIAEANAKVATSENDVEKSAYQKQEQQLVNQYRKNEMKFQTEFVQPFENQMMEYRKVVAELERLQEVEQTKQSALDTQIATEETNQAREKTAQTKEDTTQAGLETEQERLQLEQEKEKYKQALQKTLQAMLGAKAAQWDAVSDTNSGLAQVVNMTREAAITLLESASKGGTYENALREKGVKLLLSMDKNIQNNLETLGTTTTMDSAGNIINQQILDIVTSDEFEDVLSGFNLLGILTKGAFRYPEDVMYTGDEPDQAAQTEAGERAKSIADDYAVQ